MEMILDSWIFDLGKNILDILAVAYIFYFVYKLFEDTNSINVVKGFIFIILIYILASVAELKTLEWIFKYVVNYFVILLVVLFQPEIRRVLTRIGQSGIAGIRGKVSRETLDEIAQAVFWMSTQKIGGLIIIEYRVGLKQLLEESVLLDASVSAELLHTIFYKGSMLHDGAVMISGDKIVAARIMIPSIRLETIAKPKTGLGTRHMAGIAVTTESDAISVIVSEESGAVSVASKGRLDYDLSREDFLRRMHEVLGMA